MNTVTFPKAFVAKAIRKWRDRCMGMLALDNVEAVLNGRPAPTLVPDCSLEIACATRRKE
jgi:hypothetical protein